MGKIKINYKEINKVSSLYKDEANEIYNIKNELEKLYERLCNEWKDSANVGFKNKFELQIDKLDYLSDFLEDSAALLDDVSKKHSSSEDNFNNSIKKVSDIYEYRD